MVRVPYRGVPKAEVKEESRTEGEAAERADSPVRRSETRGATAQRVPDPPIRRAIKIGPEEVRIGEGPNG